MILIKDRPKLVWWLIGLPLFLLLLIRLNFFMRKYVPNAVLLTGVADFMVDRYSLCYGLVSADHCTSIS